MDRIHTSSQSGDWETPPELIADLKAVFPFDLDVCASRPNVCQRFYSPQENGLVQPWRGLCWLNPPYGKKRRIDLWMSKARLEGQQPGTTVICLPPARPDTRWWHDNVPFASLVVFIRGRLKFVNPDQPGVRVPAGFPSALVAFGELNDAQFAKLASYGWTITPHSNCDRKL